MDIKKKIISKKAIITTAVIATAILIVAYLLLSRTSRPVEPEPVVQVETVESYSFRDDKKEGCLRTVEGKFEDSHTFIGIMRIDYSDINVDSRRYEEW